MTRPWDDLEVPKLWRLFGGMKFRTTIMLKHDGHWTSHVYCANELKTVSVQAREAPS